jgi:hypothetical protein
LLLLIAGILLVSTSGLIDPLLHRGVETGEEVPFVRQNTGRELAINVDLTRFSSMFGSPLRGRTLSRSRGSSSGKPST